MQIMRTLLLDKLASGYGGYPVSTESGPTRDSERTPEQQAARDSHNYQPEAAPGKSDKLERLKREQARSRAKAKGKADPMSVIFANPESGGAANSPHVPGAVFARSLSQLNVQGNSDTMAMTHTGSVDLRRLARKPKPKLPGRSQRETKYLEGGELPSNDGDALYGHPFHGRRTPHGPNMPVTH